MVLPRRLLRRQGLPYRPRPNLQPQRSQALLKLRIQLHLVQVGHCVLDRLLLTSDQQIFTKEFSCHELALFGTFSQNLLVQPDILDVLKVLGLLHCHHSRFGALTTELGTMQIGLSH